MSSLFFFLFFVFFFLIKGQLGAEMEAVELREPLADALENGAQFSL